MRKALWLLTVAGFLFFEGGPTCQGGEGRPLGLEERIEYQVRLERLAHQHRIEQAPEPKPGFESAMPIKAVQAKVERYLKLSAALEKFWQRPLTADQLQAEMNRMARDTRQPQRLQEMFAALDNDPYVIAECLARPLLAERLVRNWYAYDDRWQGDLRKKVRAEVAGLPTGGDLKQLDGEYSEMEWRRGEEPGEDRTGLDSTPGRIVWLNEDEWNERMADLHSTLGLEQDKPLQAGLGGSVEESATGFLVSTVLSEGEGWVRIASNHWPKPAFDSWWDTEQRALEASIAEETKTRLEFSTPKIEGGECMETDTWRPTWSDFMEPRSRHTAVWTGAEMVVWGGSGNEGFLNSGGRYSPATDSWIPTNQGVNVPLGRDGYTAVWTGTEMVIWGGYHPDEGYINNGGRYSPETDSWLPTSQEGEVPLGRWKHSAVWTGTEMVVWGGYDENYLNTGGRYNPATNSWRSTSRGANVPSERNYHTAVWTGTEMVVWGGLFRDGANLFYLNSGGRYNPSADTWAATGQGADVPAGRADHTAVWTGTEMVVWGGKDLDNAYLNSGGRYAPATDSWVPTSQGANVPASRVSHTAVWTGTEMVIWGGNNANYLNSGGRYSPATDSWVPTSQGSNVPISRGTHTAVWTGTEMLVWGGYKPGDGKLKDGSRYSPLTDSWVALKQGTEVPDGRYHHTAVWTGEEMVVWGGYGDEGLTNQGGRYSPATDSWVFTNQGANLPTARHGHTAVWTGTEMVVWGGQGVGFLNSGARYSPATDSWMTTNQGTNVPSGRCFHTAIWTGVEMLVWGGKGNGYLNSGGRYSPATDSWISMSEGENLPGVRVYHTAVWTGTEMVVWGGYFYDGTNHYLNNGGRYSPATDTWASTSEGENVPAGRESHTAVWTGTEMVIWGGNAGEKGYFNSGGRYQPATDKWTSTNQGENVPAGRKWHTAIWTGTEMVVWAGERDEFQSLNSGGRYNPATDSWLATSQGANVPSERTGHTVVWVGKQMVVWGGVGVEGYLKSGGLYCASSSVAIESVTVAGSCTNGLDDDSDGFLDSYDSDCPSTARFAPLVPKAEEVFKACSAAPTFYWSPGTNDLFRVVFSTRSNLSSPFLRSSKSYQATSSWTPSASTWKTILTKASKLAGFYWGAEGRSGKKGKPVLSPSLHLILEAQSKPVPMEPADGVQVSQTEPVTFQWEPGDCNQTFQLEFSASFSFKSALRLPSRGLSQFTWTPSSAEWTKIRKKKPKGGNVIYWRVVATDNLSRKATSTARTLIIL